MALQAERLRESENFTATHWLKRFVCTDIVAGIILCDIYVVKEQHFMETIMLETVKY